MPSTHCSFCKKTHMCPVSVLWFEVFVCVWLMLNFPPHRKTGESSGLNVGFFLSLQGRANKEGQEGNLLRIAWYHVTKPFYTIRIISIVGSALAWGLEPDSQSKGRVWLEAAVWRRRNWFRKGLIHLRLWSNRAPGGWASAKAADKGHGSGLAWDFVFFFFSLLSRSWNQAGTAKFGPFFFQIKPFTCLCVSSYFVLETGLDCELYSACFCNTWRKFINVSLRKEIIKN